MPVCTDILFSAEAAAQRGAKLAKMTRWYTPAEALKMATSDNAALLLVDGDPTRNLELVADAAKNFLVVMKDGKIYKNALD